MAFTKKTLNDTIQALAKQNKIYSNESQFQFDLAWELRGKGFQVELEALSVSQAAAKQLSKEERKKAYTDIIVKDGDGYIAIELKYKTPETKDIMCYDINGVKTYLFSQGAENLGSYLYWKDVERLEKLVNGHVPLNFGVEKKVVKGYAVLLTNAEKYWNKGVQKSFATGLAREFFPIDGETFDHPLCYHIGLNPDGTRKKGKGGKIPCRIDSSAVADKYFSGKKDAKAHYPVGIKGKYTCNWETYLDGLTCKLLNGNPYKKGNEFKYLILEVKETP